MRAFNPDKPFEIEAPIGQSGGIRELLISLSWIWPHQSIVMRSPVEV